VFIVRRSTKIQLF